MELEAQEIEIRRVPIGSQIAAVRVGSVSNGEAEKQLVARGSLGSYLVAEIYIFGKSANNG